MLQIYKQSAYVSKLDFYFGHFLLIVNAYKGGPRTQISKGEEGGGANFSPGMGFLRLIPKETLYHLRFSRGGGVPDIPPYGSVLAYPKMEWA